MMRVRTRHLGIIGAGVFGIGALYWGVSLLRTPTGNEEAKNSLCMPVLEIARLVKEELDLNKELLLTLPSHRSLPRLLVKNGFSSKDATSIIKLLKSVPLKVGSKLFICYEDQEKGKSVVSLRIPVNLIYEVVVSRNSAGQYRLEKNKMPIQYEFVRVQGVLGNNILSDLVKQGVSYPTAILIVKSMTNAGLNWRLHAHSGTKFSMLFKQIRNLKTSEIAFDSLLFAKLNKGSFQKVVYRYKVPGSSCCKFYNDRGLSCQSEHLVRPVSKGRISSHFGTRQHPITHDHKWHAGVDFAAPRGTPVLAAGSGVVTAVCWNGGYGRYVKIAHAGGCKTVYGHLNRYASGLRVGQKVAQGQVIGYVGSTGHATGPHLHFEVLYGSRPVNPLKAMIQKPLQLCGQQKVEFLSYVKYLWNLYHKLPDGTS
jgi:murein DD-endopeptidase MepM/ murein hydrolase activator NlpD